MYNIFINVKWQILFPITDLHKLLLSTWLVIITNFIFNFDSLLFTRCYLGENYF